VTDPEWELEDPFVAFDRWTEQENPSEDLRYLVTEWMS
jgi:hypothetical protein